MMISVQISIYPLWQEHLSPVIQAVREALEAHGLLPEIGPMRPLVVGEMKAVC
jgi:uncharacterized protein YqgV (UPF0045/DUF77 family)